jgi:hypothetical protein
VRSPEQQQVLDVYSAFSAEVDAQDSGAKPLVYADLAQYATQEFASQIYSFIEGRQLRGNRGAVSPIYPEGTPARDIAVVAEPSISGSTADATLCVVDRIVELDAAGQIVGDADGVTFATDVRFRLDSTSGTWKVDSGRSTAVDAC